MCGRYAVIAAPEALRTLFGYEERPDFPPRHNIAPSQPIPIVRLVEGKRQFVLVRWGLIPSWVKDPRTFSLLINARAESILDKPAFRAAMRRRRCLIPADAFYEWARDGERKRPYCVRPRDGAAMAFAGLWETWTGPNGEELETAAIITTRANAALAPIHERMPVILPPQAFEMWLDCANVDAETAAALLVPALDNLLDAYEISTAVNRIANDDASLLAPVRASAMSPPSPKAQMRAPAKRPPAARPRKDDGQSSLF